MRKFLFAIILTGLSGTCATATQIIQYNNAGAVINRPDNFGSNALFTPENRMKAGERSRFIKHENQYYNGLEKGYTVNINVNGSKNNKNTHKNRKIRKFAKDKLKEQNTEAKEIKD